MSVAELKGIWIAFSVIFFCLLAGLAAALSVSTTPPRLFTGSIGLAACLSAFVMGWMASFSHIAFPLLLIPGLLLIGGALMMPKSL